MNLPNKLTLTRIILVPVFMVFVSLTQIGTEDFNPTWYLVAGIVFAAASFTDFLDGHLARKWNMVTDFGKFADPLADKLLTTVAFIYMLRDGVCSPVVLCIILAREFAVSGLRMVAAGAKDGKVIAANMWGKVKTVLQMLTIIFYYFGTALTWGNSVMIGADCVFLSYWLLAGGHCHRHLRHQVPVGQPQLHQYRKMIKKIAILCSIFLNLCIVRWEPVAIRMTWEAVGSQTFTFYTENSNVFAFFVCLLVAVCQVICLFTGRQLPRWVKTLKYIATCCLTMTFLTVVFVLGPYCADQGGVVFLLTESSMLYHHLLNPLCAFVSFVLLEREPKLSARCVPLALVPTMLYGSVALWANYQRLITGPYPFLLVYQQTTRQTVLWCAAILAMNLLYAWLVWRLGGNRRKKRNVGLLFRS